MSQVFGKIVAKKFCQIVMCRPSIEIAKKFFPNFDNVFMSTWWGNWKNMKKKIMIAQALIYPISNPDGHDRSQFAN